MITSPVDRKRSFTKGRQWTPYDVFRGGNVLGAWYDPSDLSTLFQDAAGTIPVTEVGQTIGLMKDKSGNGWHLFQNTNSSKPILSKNGLKYYLTFDGVDDYLWMNLAPMTNSGLQVNIAIALSANTTTDSRILAEGSSTSDAPIYAFQKSANTTTTTQITAYVRASGNVINYSNNTNNGAALDGQLRVITLIDRLNTLEFMVDGVTTSTPNYYVARNSTTLSGLFNQFSIGALLKTTPLSFASINFYGAIVFLGNQGNKKVQLTNNFLSKRLK